jgi:hypothetical protein
MLLCSSCSWISTQKTFFLFEKPLSNQKILPQQHKFWNVNFVMASLFSAEVHIFCGQNPHFISFRDLFLVFVQLFGYVLLV